MAPHEHLLKLMNLKPETYTTALAILASVQARTGPGSGYNLGPHSTGLPALCAYVASQQLRNNDMTAKAAQQTSCLKLRDFTRTLGIVHAVLEADPGGVVATMPGAPALASASGSPRKRRRVGSPDGERAVAGARVVPRRAVAGPSRRVSPPMVVQPPAEADHEDEDRDEQGAEGEDEEEEEVGGGRFRPVFLDRAQWCARDPRLEWMWKRAEVHRDGMVGLYGHPFEWCRTGGVGARA